jgi:hypothetical protein
MRRMRKLVAIAMELLGRQKAISKSRTARAFCSLHQMRNTLYSQYLCVLLVRFTVLDSSLVLHAWQTRGPSKRGSPKGSGTATKHCVCLFPPALCTGADSSLTRGIDEDGKTFTQPKTSTQGKRWKTVILLMKSEHFICAIIYPELGLTGTSSTYSLLIRPFLWRRITALLICLHSCYGITVVMALVKFGGIGTYRLECGRINWCEW